MKYVLGFAIVTVVLQSCGGCLRNGGRAVRNASNEKIITHTDQAVRDLDPSVPKPVRSGSDNISHGSSDVRLLHNTETVLKDVTFNQQNFDFYLRNFFMDNPEWTTSVNGSLAKVEYMGSLDANRSSVADLYKELSTMFNVSVCIDPGNDGPGISFSLGKNGQELYEIEINSQDGFSLVAQTNRTIEKGFLGAANLSVVHSSELRSLRPDQIKLNTQICFPLTDSELKLSTANGEVSISPQSLSFKF